MSEPERISTILVRVIDDMKDETSIGFPEVIEMERKKGKRTHADASMSVRARA